jgi:tRNA (uracil-5-)-methyltransferase TRM9
MDEHTIRRLNAINREFYATVADEFDASRGHAWKGWERLLPLLQPPLSVLDVGCGNGRFGVFLMERLGQRIRYHGIDSNPALLEHARQSLTLVDTQLEESDIVEQPPDTGSYDLVTLFGVLHHIPGAHQRQALLKTLAERVALGSLLVFTCWRFYEYPRFRERIAPMPPDLKVEQGDYLLDWRRGANALRYCHYVDDAELAQLISATNLSLLTQYRADGQTDDLNLYIILKSENTFNQP